MGRPLKIAKAQAVVTITDTTAATGLVTTSANFTNLGIIAGMPFIPASNVGNLVAGTTYWILQVVNAGANSTFTVSATQLSANPTYTAFTLADAGPVTVAASVGVVDAYFNNPNGGAGYPATNANTYSVVGGNTAIYGSQVLCQVAIGVAGTGTLVVENGNTTVTGTGTIFTTELSAGSVLTTSEGELIGFVDSITTDTELELDSAATEDYTDISFVFADNEAGFIVRQKGKQKYLVQGSTSGLVGPCYTANIANAALLPNTMSIIATYANAATTLVQSLSDHTVEIFTATSGETALPNETANINNSSPAFGTFNTAYAANTYGGQPYPIVTINQA
jgi:hypothetical protein